MFLRDPAVNAKYSDMKKVVKPTYRTSAKQWRWDATTKEMCALAVKDSIFEENPSI